MSDEHPRVEDLLPLPLAAFHILVSLRVEERHGYAIMQDVADRTDGRVTLSPGTLYRSIHRMREQGLIVESDGPSAADDDERRRYYRITDFGVKVARAEAARLAELVGYARESGLSPEPA